MSSGWRTIIIEGMDCYEWLYKRAKRTTHKYYDEISTTTTLLYDDGYQKQYKTVIETDDSITIYLYIVIGENEPTKYIDIIKDKDCANNEISIVEHEKSGKENVYEKGMPKYNGYFYMQDVDEVFNGYHYNVKELERDIGIMMI